MNPWKRKGFFYECTIKWTTQGRNYASTYEHTRTRRLDFVSYHLIRLIHGEKELIRMGTEI